MSKKDLILDTMEALLSEKKGASCSVGDIARRAGIAKGGLYYYFKSKEEVFDALVERTYGMIIESCRIFTIEDGKSAPQRLALLYKHYTTSFVSADLDACLHEPQNAHIHQKSLAKILTGLSPIIEQIIEQGVKEGTFQCAYPREMSELIMSAFCFLLDPGIFSRTPQQIKETLTGLAHLLEKGLGTEVGALDFLIP